MFLASTPVITHFFSPQSLEEKKGSLDGLMGYPSPLNYKLVLTGNCQIFIFSRRHTEGGFIVSVNWLEGVTASKGKKDVKDKQRPRPKKNVKQSHKQRQKEQGRKNNYIYLYTYMALKW